MSRISELLDNADEFVIITTKNNGAQLDVGVIMGCDPEGPMLDVLDNIVKDAKDAASNYNQCTETDGNQAESDSDQATGCASSV